MDFFEAQEKALKQTRRLVLWFALCVVGVMITLYLAAVFIRPFLIQPDATHLSWWDPQLAAIICPTVGGIIVLGSLFKLVQLSAGGSVVARDMGARPVDPSTSDPLERRLLNVVEEMSIASGLSAPQVWVMDAEDGINAFAAGTDPTNAVVAVTRGCLERLNREELQGVVGHEFSHILNGDMKLNMRLMGWVFGLIMIAMLGKMLIELLRFSRGSRDSKGNGAIIGVVVAGLAMWLVGSIGVFFARLLQAAVSRQREFLADASAVQFTRNPDSLANALKKIGGFSKNGALHSSKASEARHMFFVKSELMGLGFSTHPPLKQRIKAIDPSWNGEMLQGETEEIFRDRERPDPDAPFWDGRPSGAIPSRLAPESEPLQLEELGDSQRMDPKVGEAIHRQLSERNVVFRSKTEAKALLYGLLLAQDPTLHESCFDLLATKASRAMAENAAIWNRELAGRPASEKLALVDLSLPWLRRMSRSEAKQFIEITRELIHADGHVNLFEFMLQKVIERQIAVGLGLRAVAGIRYHTLADVSHEAAVLIGAFAAISGDPEAVEAGVVEFWHRSGVDLNPVDPEKCTLADVAKALVKLEAASPVVKVRILKICALVALHDNSLEDGEIELLRAAAEAIGAPLPPLSTAMKS